MAYNKRGYYRRALRIQEITNQYYEPENHRKCKKAIWRRYIEQNFGICYDTYLRYLRTEPPEPQQPTEKQLSLFEDLE